ncbi:hypothetical protein JTE90_006931 [Oedothorax gibbosus]|uniref:Uncharacterized protein n=1 Tax=Oedothorax gibbosus TaxID=931172 RepID=A0AAV6VPQ9_9ARAC|nr:hypothetical protein JTE90_006931 [Oedothorax gibbosus]
MIKNNPPFMQPPPPIYATAGSPSRTSHVPLVKWGVPFQWRLRHCCPTDPNYGCGARASPGPERESGGPV